MSENKAICYHCGQESGGMVVCNLWEVNTCKTCHKKHHLPDHKSCHRVDPKGFIEAESVARPTKFSIHLTRFDGYSFPMQCEKGQNLRMEEHWMGTYIIFKNGLTLVREDREGINRQLIAGLRSLQAS